MTSMERKSNSAYPVSGKRKTYIDILKIIAIFLVIFNHTSTNGFLLFLDRRDSAFYVFYLFNAIFIKIAVPLFFMASGALMLGREEPYKVVLRKRFLRYFIVLVVASAIIYIDDCYNVKPRDMSLVMFFTKLYVSEMRTAYWFLYAYLAYLLMLPLLRKLAKSMSSQDYNWMILLYTILRLMTIIEFFLWQGKKTHNSRFDFFFMADCVFYPLIGYYFDTKKETKKTEIIFYSCAGLAAIILCCFMTHYRCTLLDDWSTSSCQKFFSTLIFAPTIAAFILIKKLMNNRTLSARSVKIIELVSGTTFGIYLFENIYRRITEPVLLFFRNKIGALPACWIWVLSAFLIGCIITMVLKRIPGIKKFI